MIEKLLNKIGLTTKSALQKEYDRGWASGRLMRFQQDWSIARHEINNEIKSDLPALRARVADLRKNNPIVSAYAIDNRVSIIGPEGFDLQPMVKRADGSDDNYANTIIKNEFELWGNRETASLNQRYSFLMLEYLFAEELFVKNELIIRKYTSGGAVNNNRWRFTIEILNPDWIDHDYDAILQNGNIVVMGVEFDRYKRIRGIWIKEKDLYSEVVGGFESYSRRIRIDASELIIAFDPLSYNQVHGVTPLAASMLKIKNLDMWDDYNLENAKFSAAKMGFITKNEKSIGAYRGYDEEDERGKYMDLEGGTIEELGIGEDFKQFDPKFPSDQHAAFVRSMSRIISAGIGRDQSALLGDRENETYSSARTGELKNRANYAYQQSIMKEMVLTPLYEAWLSSALLSGALDPLRYVNYNRYRNHYWQGYVRPWVDQQKEIQANILAEKYGYKSKIQIVSEMGNRYEDILRDKAHEKKLEGKYGVKLNIDEKDMKAREPAVLPDVPKNGNGKAKITMD